MNDLKFNLGDIGYIVRYHKKGKINIGYYIDKVRICDFKNKELKLRNDYKNKLRELRECP